MEQVGLGISGLSQAFISSTPRPFFLLYLGDVHSAGLLPSPYIHGAQHQGKKKEQHELQQVRKQKEKRKIARANEAADEMR